jgi:hypothetical protein
MWENETGDASRTQIYPSKILKFRFRSFSRFQQFWKNNFFFVAKLSSHKRKQILLSFCPYCCSPPNTLLIFFYFFYELIITLLSLISLSLALTACLNISSLFQIYTSFTYKLSFFCSPTFLPSLLIYFSVSLSVCFYALEQHMDNMFEWFFIAGCQPQHTCLLFSRRNSVIRPSSIVGMFRGKRWDVRLDFVRQFKTDYVRRLEGLVFEKKKKS